MTDLETADGVTIVRFDNAPVNALDLDLLELIIASMHSVEGPVVITASSDPKPALICPVGPSRPVSTYALSPMVEPTTPAASSPRCLRLFSRSTTTRRRWSRQSTGMRSQADACWPCVPMCD